jgi:maleylacetate reductase
MKRFVHTNQPARIVFGAGSIEHLPREIELLGVRKALVLSTPGRVRDAERVAQLIGTCAAGIFPQAAMHVPIETARAAQVEAKRLGADGVVAIGGGSTTGLAKAIAHCQCSRFPRRMRAPKSLQLTV